MTDDNISHKDADVRRVCSKYLFVFIVLATCTNVTKTPDNSKLCSMEHLSIKCAIIHLLFKNTT